MSWTMLLVMGEYFTLSALLSKCLSAFYRTLSPSSLSLTSFGLPCPDFASVQSCPSLYVASISFPLLPLMFAIENTGLYHALIFCILLCSNFGKVYKAYKKSNGAVVAIKILPINEDDERQLKKLVDEIKVLKVSAAAQGAESACSGNRFFFVL